MSERLPIREAVASLQELKALVHQHGVEDPHITEAVSDLMSKMRQAAWFAHQPLTYIFRVLILEARITGNSPSFAEVSGMLYDELIRLGRDAAAEISAHMGEVEES